MIMPVGAETFGEALRMGVDTRFFGNDPHFEHLMNILLFGLSCVILLLVLQLLLKKLHPLIPLLITMVFVFHPVHTEVVASIKSRDEILSWLFGLLSFYYLLKHAENFRLKKNLYRSLFCFFLSILSKENSLTFVIIVPLMLYLFTEVPLKKIISTSIPYALLILIYMLIRYSVLESITFKDKIVIMNNGLMAAKTGGELFGTNFVILGKYLWLLLFPVNLTWDYSYSQVPVVTFSDWRAILPLFVYLGMGIYVILFFRKKDIFVFAILFYLITLFLSSNLIVKIGATMGERFLYVPSLGFCIALVFLLLKVFKLNPAAVRWQNQNALFFLLGAIFLLYGFKTVDRNKAWKNNFELFSSGLEVSTMSARAHWAIASEYRLKGEAETDRVKRQNDFKVSVDEYEKGIKIYQDDPEVWYNLGVTYFDQGDTANARKVYARAIEMKPNYSMAMNNTGVIYFNQKNYPKALYYFNRILETDSTFTDAIGNIGATYHNMGDYKKAAGYYEKALVKDPNNKSTLQNIATVYKSLGDTLKANSFLHRLSSIH